MGKPQEMIPRYVQVLKEDCDTKRRKCVSVVASK